MTKKFARIVAGCYRLQRLDAEAQKDGIDQEGVGRRGIHGCKVMSNQPDMHGNERNDSQLQAVKMRSCRHAVTGKEQVGMAAIAARCGILHHGMLMLLVQVRRQTMLAVTTHGHDRLRR